MRKIASLTLLIIFGFGCGGGDLPEAFLLGDLRVLAILADQPEASPGDTVILTPYMSDLNAGGRTITYSAQGCLDPGIGRGVTPSCEGAPSKVDLAQNVVVTGLSAPMYTGYVTSPLSVTLPSADLVFSGASNNDQANGIAYVIVFRFQTADGQELVAFRRVIISSKSKKNTNPSFLTTPILLNDSPLTVLPTEKVSISSNPDLSTAESFELLRDNGAVTSSRESFLTSWFVSDGKFSTTITDPTQVTKYTPPDSLPTSHPVFMVVVLRDGRDGVAVSMISF